MNDKTCHVFDNGVNIQNIYRSHTIQQQKSKQSNLKLNRISEQAFFKEDNTDGQQLPEKVLNITNQKNASHNHCERSQTVRMGYYKKDKKYW